MNPDVLLLFISVADEWEGRIAGASRQAPPTTTQMLRRSRRDSGVIRIPPQEQNLRMVQGFARPDQITPDLRSGRCAESAENLWSPVFLFPSTAVKSRSRRIIWRFSSKRFEE